PLRSRRGTEDRQGPPEPSRTSETVALELEFPGELTRLRLPPGVEARLQDLRDRESGGTPLSPAERDEAEGLAELADLLSVLCRRAERLVQQREIIAMRGELRRIVRQDERRGATGCGLFFLVLVVGAVVIGRFGLGLVLVPFLAIFAGMGLAAVSRF